MNERQAVALAVLALDDVIERGAGDRGWEWKQARALLGGMLGRMRRDWNGGGEDLTPRQKEITCLVAHGLSNAQIGFELGISERTVVNHMSSILRRTGEESRLGVVLLALRKGWVHLEECGPSSE